ncbi:hypothetical protein BpHYR1_031928, partial [Brachionus plicatilis]
QQTVIELPLGLDGDSDNEQIDDYYSSDFFKKRNGQDADEETLADDKDTDTVITTYNMSQVIEQKASILITQSSSSDSCVESKDPKIKIKKGRSPARREFGKKISNDLPGSYFEPIKSQLIDDSQKIESFDATGYEFNKNLSNDLPGSYFEPMRKENEFTYESETSKQFEKHEQLSKKFDKNGKIYYEIICPEFENKDKEVHEQTEFLFSDQQDEQREEENKIFFLSHVDTSNAKGKIENFEYLSEDDKYIKFCPNDDDPKPNPTPKVTINLLKDINSVDKLYSYNQQQ